VYHRPTRLIISPVLLALLVACGGGGGGGGGGNSTPPPTVTLAYPSPSYAFTVGATIYNQFTPGIIAGIQPVVSGGTLTAWSVSPSLPAGLTLSAKSGVITGVASVATPAAQYTVTATGPGGAQATTTVTIQVSAAPLLNLGLANLVSRVRYVNTSVLSEDDTGTWVLQDFVTGTTLATGIAPVASDYLPGYVDLENNTMIDQAGGGLEVRSATTGNLQATITPATPASWYRLAADASYIVAGSASALTVWSPSGQLLLSVSGNYQQAIPFAASGQVQIANGPAGASVIETITVPAGTSTTSPAFQGTFGAWFVDGQRFVTSLGSSVWVYSNAAVKQDFGSPAGVCSLGGSGDWYWSAPCGSQITTSQFSIYQVGSGATPAASLSFAADDYPEVFASGTTLGVLLDYGSDPPLTVFDLSGAAPVATTFATLPYGPASTFAAQSPTEWLVGTGSGIVLDGTSLGGTPRSLTLGTAYSVAAGTSFISVSTAVGKIFVFNASDDSPAGTIDFAASQLAASADGSVLAAVSSGISNQISVNIYSLPSGTLTTTFDYSNPDSLIFLPSLTLSASGNALGEVFSGRPASACLAQVISVPAGATILCDNTGQSSDIQLSPDGTLIADSTSLEALPNINLYQNGALVTTLPGYAVGWLSNSQLLVDDYAIPSGTKNLESTGTTIFDASGNQVGTTPLTTTSPFMLVPGSPTSLYYFGPGYGSQNTIVSLTTADTTWASGNAETFYEGLTPGAVTGSQVVFISNNMILAQPY
jgi:Putative Ig domain